MKKPIIMCVVLLTASPHSIASEQMDEAYKTVFEMSITLPRLARICNGYIAEYENKFIASFPEWKHVKRTQIKKGKVIFQQVATKAGTDFDAALKVMESDKIKSFKDMAENKLIKRCKKNMRLVTRTY